LLRVRNNPVARKRNGEYSLGIKTKVEVTFKADQGNKVEKAGAHG